MFRVLSLLLLTITMMAACLDDIYVRDGVTGGDSYHISPEAMLDDDPVQQSWVVYSLRKSVCQLEIGGENPARANSYGCELSSRLGLLDEWAIHRAADPQLYDDYLNTLARVRDEAFLDEYVAHYFGNKNWRVPAEIEDGPFEQWRRIHLQGHKPYTRIVGSWSFKE